MQLRPKLYVHKDLRCNGKRYPKGSVLPWRDAGLSTQRVLLLLKTQYLGDEQWPGHKGKPLEPEQLKIETGHELEARLKQEQREREAREELLEERKRELMGEGRSAVDAASQAVGELAAMCAETELLEDEQDERVERAERARQQQEDRERLEAEEAEAAREKREAQAWEKREAEEQARLEAKCEAEAKAKLEAEAEAHEKAKLPLQDVEGEEL